MAHEGHDHDHDHAPDHDRTHARDLAHDHARGHDHDPTPSSSELERGSGIGKVLFLDAPSGLAGDMVVAALVDLGVPRDVVAHALACLPLAGFHVEFGSRVRSGVVATSFDVHVDAGQAPRTYARIRAMLASAPLPEGTKASAQRIFLRLAIAEAKVHRMPIDDVHFHEVGGVDAIVDIVSSAAALDHVGAEIWVSPLPMGRGMVRAAHGLLPLPAPATVECLSGLATYDGGLDFEFVTPTGAAIVGAAAAGWSRWPSMAPERSGWGAGTAELADRPNVLRAVLGSPFAAPRDRDARATHTVLEANIDDATGELAGSWIDALLSAGALDAWFTPVIMKKGRPGLTISALCAIERADAMAQTMLRETTSLGVRRYDVARDERPRTVESVVTPFGTIPIKVARGPYGPAQVKPEFDACLRAARDYGVPVREVILAALAVASRPDR